MTGNAGTAIIIGAEPRTVLAIARSLQRAKVRCIVAIPRGRALGVSSRAIASTLRLHPDVTESAEVLARLARSEGAGWVVPTSDASLQIVCAAYDELSRSGAIGAPPPSVVRRALDKSIVLEVARSIGVPTPASITIARAGEIEAALGTIRFPAVARLRDRSRQTAREFRTRLFTSVDELRATFATQSRFGDGLLFQSYHEGDGIGLDLLLSKGAPVTSVQLRRLSAHPPTGAAVAAISEPVDATLLDYSVRLLRALEWDGVASVEFRRNRESGAVVLTDVVAHFRESLPLDIAAGVDVPLYAWQMARGIVPAPPSSYRQGLRMRWTAGSLSRTGAALDQSPKSRPSMRASLKQIAADFAPGTKSATWSWRDPQPAIQEVAHVIGERAKDATKFALQAIVPGSLLSIVKDSRNLVADRRAGYVTRRVRRMLGVEAPVSLPPRAQSVLFVCHGNIMRSAAAAGFLRDELRAAGITDVKIGSAGTHAHDGRPADARAQDAARQLGLSLREHAATRLTTRLVADYDVIFAMDDLNYVNILATFPESRGKLLLFGGMTESGSYRAHEIADPYMTTAGEVNTTITTIKGYVAKLARALISVRRDRA